MSTTKKIICPTESLKMLGDFWSLSIIQILNHDEKRFTELQREIKNINPTTLSNRLKKLELENLITRKEETLNKISVIYKLTKKGKDLLPVFEQIKKFSEKYR